MNTYSPEQVKEILDRAVKKSANLTPDDLREVALQSSIPDWCLEDAIAEVEAEPIAPLSVQLRPMQPSTQPQPAKVGYTVSSKSGCRLFSCPAFLLTGSLTVVWAASSVLAGNMQFQSYKRTAQPALEAATQATTSASADPEIKTAIEWFKSQGQDFPPSPQVETAFAHLRSIEAMLEEKQSPQLTVADQEAIALVAKAVDDGYERISAGSQLQRLLDLSVSLFTFGVCSFYLGLKLARQSQQRSAQ